MAKSRRRGKGKTVSPGAIKMNDMKAIWISFIFILAFALACPQAGAEGESSQDKVAIEKRAIEKRIPSYANNLKRLIKKAEINIKKVDEKLKEQEREELARECCEKANALYGEGKLKEAKGEWRKALKMARKRQTREYIKKSKQRAIEEARLKNKQKGR